MNLFNRCAPIVATHRTVRTLPEGKWRLTPPSQSKLQDEQRACYNTFGVVPNYLLQGQNAKA
jgi:hypothetical protein